MKKPSLPKNEIERLIALKQYNILDSVAEESFDDITSLASQICGTNIALITLLDENRQWFKSTFGLDASETSRDISFCGHAILGTNLFEIPNALHDDRFSDNPLVTGDPNIRFYAGYPLITEHGYALGTLCVIDQKPKELTAEQRNALTKLGRQVVMQIEHRLNTLQLAKMAELLEHTGQLAKVGGWELDLRNMHIEWTKEVFCIHEIDSAQPPKLEDAIMFYAPEARPIITAAVEHGIATGTPWDIELPFITAKNRAIWVRAQGSPIMENGKVIRLVGAFQDITQRKQSELDLAWLNRALLMLSKCNETLIHMTDENRLIVEICRIIVVVGGYKMAWVGYVEDDDFKSIIPQAYFGDNQGFLDEIKLSWSSDHVNGQGPGGKTIRNGKPIIVEDMQQDPSYPFKDAVLKHGFMGLASLPLKNNGQTFGLLGMYTSEVRQFSAQEAKLLEELTDNLASGINNIRAEKERQQLNNAILNLAKAVSTSSGEEFFANLVSTMLNTVGAQAGYIAQLLPEKPLKGHTVAVVSDAQRIEDFEFLIPDAIATEFFGDKDLHIVPRHAAEHYPNLSMMRFYPYQAFAGLCLSDSTGKHIGLLFAYFKDPIREDSYDLIQATLKIFAARAASELAQLEADEIILEQASLLDKTHDVIVVRNLHHQIIFWNKAAEELYGWTKEQALNQTIHTLLKQDPVAFEAATAELYKHDEWTGEMTEYDKTGNQLIIESHWTLVRDQQGQPKSIFAIKSDISSRKQKEEEIRQLAFYDPLTKLPNRRLLLDRLEQALLSTKRNKQSGVFMFIDLDNFKTLNDTLGHDKGDLLLIEVANRLKQCVRAQDTVARLGGDEFVILMGDLSASTQQAQILAKVVGEKILAQLNSTFDFDGYQHISTPSIGVALFNHETSTVDQLMKDADSAMYKSKAAGRNRMTLFGD